ncbi:MAG: phosphate signaling complex protein PhoU [Pelagibacterales bacterium]|nr:phosphate signaling complex protein PhoU [Pelagibacterales bacterium]
MTLKEHTVKSYDKDLKSIEGTIDEMMHLVIMSIDMVAEMIKYNQDSNIRQDFLEKIIAHDYKINTLDFLVERKVTTMLALRQPMAVDLRYIVSALKVSSNLERVGDQAKSIIKKIDRIGSEAFEDKVKKAMLEMVDLTKKMVHDSIIAFNEQNFQTAESVLKQDDQIDKIYSGLFMILENESFSKSQAERIINILFIAKSFERLADHSTNIADIAKYVVTGDSK